MENQELTNAQTELRQQREHILELEKRVQEMTAAISRNQDNREDTQQVTAAEIQAVTTKGIKLPQFWKEHTELWFCQIEVVFDLHNIRSDANKFKYTVAHLDKDSLPFVKDILDQPPNENKFQTLKQRIIGIFGESDETRMRRLLSSDIGDIAGEKPSAILYKIKALATQQCPDTLLRTIFLEKMPENVRAILVSARHANLQEMAEQADKITEALNQSTPTVAATYHDKPKRDSSLVARLEELAKDIKILKNRTYNGNRSRSRQRNNSRDRQDSNEEGLCFYHRRFGNEAINCDPTCKRWKPKSPKN